MFLEAMLTSPQWLIPLDLVKHLLHVLVIWQLFWVRGDVGIMCTVFWYCCFVWHSFFNLFFTYFGFLCAEESLFQSMAAHSFTCSSFRGGLHDPLPANLGGRWLLQSVEYSRSDALLPKTQGCKTTTHFPWWLMKDSALFAGQMFTLGSLA